MKIYFLALSVTLMASACNTSPKADETTTLLKSDSTFVVGPELPLVKSETTSSIRTVEKSVWHKGVAQLPVLQPLVRVVHPEPLIQQRKKPAGAKQQKVL